MEVLTQKLEEFYRSYYGSTDFIPLHRPIFVGEEKRYLERCIDSTFVSSVGEYVDRFADDLAKYTGAKYAVPVVNGTSGLHLALHSADVKPDCEVVTQALTFVATGNAISYTGASPVFVDVDKDTLGMSPKALKSFLYSSTEAIQGKRFNKKTGREVKACMPMHTFGFPCRIAELATICNENNIVMIEDAAEALGSHLGDRHMGLFGKMGVLSFNGNKIITTGGGGAILTNEEETAVALKHLSTTAKTPHKWEYKHDAIAYNYRMPNINAAIGCAQLNVMPKMVAEKKRLKSLVGEVLEDQGVAPFSGMGKSSPNEWLITLDLKTRTARDAFLEETNRRGLQTRPIWDLLSSLEMYKHCQTDGLPNSKILAEGIVNIPSWPAEDQVVG